MEYQGSVVREGLYFGECPRWHDGRLWYSDFYDHAVHALLPAGPTSGWSRWRASLPGWGGCLTGRCSSCRWSTAGCCGSAWTGTVGEHADLAGVGAVSLQRHGGRRRRPGVCRATSGYDIFGAPAGGAGGAARPTVLIRSRPRRAGEASRPMISGSPTGL